MNGRIEQLVLKYVYMTVGFISLGLGLLGFHYLFYQRPRSFISYSLFCKSSQRFEKWLHGTKL